VYIIFLGAPGAGKGTQAANVAKELALVHVSSGDLFRATLAQGTEFAQKVKSYMEKGMLVPDELTVKMVLDRLSAPDIKAGALLDGFPRTLAQAEALDKALAREGKGIDKVVYIKVADDELVRRLGGRWICRKCQMPYHEVESPPRVKGKCDKCGGELYQRADDTPETVKKRLEVYAKETRPLISYYAAKGKLAEVDGEGGVAAVSGRIIAAIKQS